MTRPTIRYSKLPPEARQFLDAIIDAWIDKTDAIRVMQMGRKRVREAMITLLERGVAQLIHHGVPGAEATTYSITIDPSYLRMH
jgi:hypothetical protein